MVWLMLHSVFGPKTKFWLEAQIAEQLLSIFGIKMDYFKVCDYDLKLQTQLLAFNLKHNTEVHREI